MVQLIITPNIISAIKNLSEDAQKHLSLPVPVLNAPISHTQLIALSRTLSDGNEKRHAASDNEEAPYSLDFLLRGTKIYIAPPPPKPEPSPEYLSLKSKLQAEAEARKYNALLHPISPSSSKRQPSPIFSSAPPSSMSSKPDAGAYFDADSLDTDPLSPSLALNILISILFTGFATYWALSNFRIPAFLTFSSSRGDTHPGSLSSQPFRVFLSMFLAMVVGVAEVGVYAAYWRKVVAAKEKEKKIIEKKVVVGEVEENLANSGDNARNGDSHGVSVGETSEKLEIWGKGVNGGARRRVRERWQGREEE